MPKIEGVGAIKYNFSQRIRRTTTNGSAVVGYAAPYAVYQHENIEYNHTYGQAKFLEKPAREHKDELADTVAKALRNGAPFKRALMLGAIRLLKISWHYVPYETGFLRESGFTRWEDGWH